MKNKPKTAPLVFTKMKRKTLAGVKKTRFNKIKIIPGMIISEHTFYKCITQF